MYSIVKGIWWGEGYNCTELGEVKPKYDKKELQPKRTTLAYKKDPFTFFLKRISDILNRIRENKKSGYRHETANSER